MLSFHVCLLCTVVFGHLLQAAAQPGDTSTSNSSSPGEESFTSPTPAPAPGGTAGDNVTIATATPSPPEESTTQQTWTVWSPTSCLCDLTPGFCDIDCCCDTADCDVANLSTVFTGCPQKVIPGVCIEKWLIFKTDVNSSLVTVTDSLFCVRAEDETVLSLPALNRHPVIGDSYHFSPPKNTYTRHSREFYRVDDLILTYFSNSSVGGFLHQPSPGAASSSCINRNPAKFLRSTSSSCSRMVTPLSCTTDPKLNARSYFSDLSLIKIPISEKVKPESDLLIPVIPRADWPAPASQNNSCVNVVTKVEFVIGYTSRGELAYATINVVLDDVGIDQLLLQTHSVYFQLATPSTSPGRLITAAGLKVGSPVVGRFDEEVQPVTLLGLPRDGECSSDPSTRVPILFTHNTFTGCIFNSPGSNCSQLRSQIYAILRGPAAPDVIAMNSGSQPDWTRVIAQECPINPQETCDSGCTVPHSLSIQVLWARQGFIDLPQKYILGAKYLFHCQIIKCPLPSPLALTTTAAFTETTVYPEAPRGSPQPHWKFPFDFFTRGSAELDGHFAASSSSSSSSEVTWTLMLLIVMLLTGLEFLNR
ncbi:tectonic-3-like [Cololabis saira]|uniref:tectonic-3-like n=1 Tax=Cololabis saira TaxID=129043 RepID=UPI002AD43399|nr:tectonic-3-like [Cololabis saira]